MQKKYQVFVSSTYDDLHEERQEVMHALLELDCIPAGMELFPAANEDQWSLIRGVIDDCDYYIVISSGRYGSLGPDGLSYTEMEYKYAIDCGKPVIAFLHKEPDTLPKNRTESTEEGQKRLSAFRDRLKERMCKFWTTPQDLGSVVSRSLIMLQRKHPGIGWVRGDLVPSQEAGLEILELRKQIESLHAKLEEARTQAPPGTERLAQGDDTFEVRWHGETRMSYETFTWAGSDAYTWNHIFYTISPTMIQEATESEIETALEGLVAAKAIQSIKKDKAAIGHTFRRISVNSEDFQTIKVQLRALGLMTKATKNRSVKDTNAYWTLTPYGDSIMNQLRAILSDKGVG